MNVNRFKDTLKQMMDTQVHGVIDVVCKQPGFEEAAETASKKELVRLCLTVVLEQVAITLYTLDEPNMSGITSAEIKQKALQEVVAGLMR